MIVSTPLLQNTSVDRLVKLWAQRYAPDWTILSSVRDGSNISEVIQMASPEARVQTVAKIERPLQTSCELAGIKTNILFSYIPNVVNLIEAGRIARSAAQAYGKLLKIYKQQSPPLPSPTATSESEMDLFQWMKQALEIPEIQQLAVELEPELIQLQDEHLSAEDRRTVGFLSTQFHFSTKQILLRLTPPEQVLLSPYFKFLEEQVCIPWQRVCAAAAQHQPDSPILLLVEQLLPQSEEIALTVYRRAVELYPNHRSNRGTLNDSRVAASTLRDLNMFQGYLWLCVLEDSMASVEQELLPLCQMVFPNVEVRGELVESMVQWLSETVLNRVDFEKQSLLKPYTSAMQQLFSNFEANVK